MGVYQVTCVTREDCNLSPTGWHITGARVEGSEGTRDFDAGALRLMLSSGDVLTIGDPTSAAAEVRKGKCECGAKTIRTRRRDDDGKGLNALPDC